MEFVPVRFINPHRKPWEDLQELLARPGGNTLLELRAAWDAPKGPMVTGEVSALRANYGSRYTLPDGRIVELTTSRDTSGRRISGINIVKIDGKLYGRRAHQTFAYDDFDPAGDGLSVVTRTHRWRRGEWQPEGLISGPVHIEGRELDAFFKDITPPAEGIAN